MAYTIIGSVSLAIGNNATGTTGTLDTTGADLLLMAVTYYTGAGTLTVSDSKSNSWTSARETDVTVTSRHILANFHIRPTTVGTGHTFTAATSGGSVFGCISVIAAAGSPTSPFDVEHGGQDTGSGSTSVAPGSITPAGNGELLIASYGIDDPGGNTFSVDSGFTIAQQHDDSPGNVFGLVHAYLIQSTAAAINPTLTRSVANSGSGADSAHIAAFKVTAGGGGGTVAPPPTLLFMGVG